MKSWKRAQWLRDHPKETWRTWGSFSHSATTYAEGNQIVLPFVTPSEKDLEDGPVTKAFIMQVS